MQMRDVREDEGIGLTLGSGSMSRASLEFGVVAEGTRCTACGYELEGLSVSGVCPECGIAVSLVLDILEMRRSTGWRRVVRSGLGRVLLGIMLIPVGVVLVYVVAFINFAAQSNAVGPLIQVMFSFGVSLVGLFLFFEGWWRAMRPGVWDSDMGAIDAPRRHARSALLILAVCVGLVLGSLYLTDSVVMYAAVGLALLALMAHCAFTMRYVMTLAERARCEGLRTAAGWCRWVLPVLFFPGWVLLLSVFVIPLWILGFTMYVVIVMDTRLAVSRVPGRRPLRGWSWAASGLFEARGGVVDERLPRSSPSSPPAAVRGQDDRPGGIA